MAFILNVNQLDKIKEITIKAEAFDYVIDIENVKHTKFGPINYLFYNEDEAIDHVNLIIDDEINVLSSKLLKLKDKKSKVKKKVE